MRIRLFNKPSRGWCHKARCKAQIIYGIVWCVFAVIDVSGAAFRLSFLAANPVLDDTCQLLEKNGFSQDSVAAFKRLVEEHNRPGNRVDLGKFPACENGYYYFDSFDDFTNRTVGGFSETPGSNSYPQTTLMCFDVACLLLRGAGHDAPLLENDFSAKGFVTVQPDGRVVPANSKSFLDAVGVLSPAINYELLVGRPRTISETRMGLSLRTKRHLPPDVTNSDGDLHTVFATHVEDIRKDGFAFPTNCLIGLGLVVNPNRHYIWGDHSFICIATGGRFICLEKNGTKGPYVRVEFSSEKDVGQYMSWDLLLDVTTPNTANYASSVMISLNDRLIGIYRPRIP